METDLFLAGDETRGAARMIAHVNKYITHKECTNWLKELQALISGQYEEIEDNP